MVQSVKLPTSSQVNAFIENTIDAFQDSELPLDLIQTIEKTGKAIQKQKVSAERKLHLFMNSVKTSINKRLYTELKRQKHQSDEAAVKPGEIELISIGTWSQAHKHLNKVFNKAFGAKRVVATVTAQDREEFLKAKKLSQHRNKDKIIERDGRFFGKVT